MNGLLITLCLFGMVVVALARPRDDHRGPPRGTEGRGEKRGDSERHTEGRPGRGGERGRKGGLECEVISARFNLTKACVDSQCFLGPLITTDADGNQVSKKFCDAVNADGTSLVAKGACLITDEDGDVLVNRTRPHFNKPDDDVDRPVVECIVEMDILFENKTAKAFFPNGTKGHHGGKGGRRHGGKDSSEEDEDEDDSEEDEDVVIVDPLRDGQQRDSSRQDRRGSRSGDAQEQQGGTRQESPPPRSGAGQRQRSGRRD